ncbi:MAG: hypothetical protein HQL37_06085 [Alphaproteobacteria bacterium]|nr:hypothetical protein [Alphaproteobacteria bacterium]
MLSTVRAAAWLWISLTLGLALSVPWPAGAGSEAGKSWAGKSEASKTGAEPESAQAPVTLESVFAGRGVGYSIHYPKAWRVTRPGGYTVVFGGAPDTVAYYTTVSIDNRLSPRPDDIRLGAAAIMAQYTQELATLAHESKVLLKAPFFYRKDLVRLEGYQTVAEFSGTAERMRQWVVVLPRRSGTVVHVWIFTAPTAEFDHALPTAQAMLDSWKISDSDTE